MVLLVRSQKGAQGWTPCEPGINVCVFNDLEAVRHTSAAFTSQAAELLHTASLSQRILYVKEGEIATCVSEDSFDIIGSDDATTCHLIIARCGNRTSRMCMVAHIDRATRCQSLGRHLLELSTRVGCDTIDVYVSGGLGGDSASKDISESLLKLLNDLSIRCRIYLWSTLELNSIPVTSKTNSFVMMFKPCVLGIGLSMSGGILNVRPCHFPVDTRGPEITVRNATNWAEMLCPDNDQTTDISQIKSEDLIVVYDGREGVFRIDIASLLHIDERAVSCCQYFQQISNDAELLEYTSTSPFCEPPHYVNECRKAFSLINNMYTKCASDHIPLPLLPHLVAHDEYVQSRHSQGKPLPLSELGSHYLQYIMNKSCEWELV